MEAALIRTKKKKRKAATANTFSCQLFWMRFDVPKLSEISQTEQFHAEM